MWHRALAALCAAALAASCSSPAPNDGSPSEPAPPATSADPDGVPSPEPDDRAPDDQGPVDQGPADDPAQADGPAAPELSGALDRLVERAEGELDTARLAVLALDGEGRELVELDADEPRLPASTAKLATAAGLLATLGPDARLPTSLEATAPIEPDGSIDGDLWLAGSGDPSLSTFAHRRYLDPNRPATELSSLADQLVEAGVERITGDVVGGAPGFEGPHFAEGWPQRYLDTFNARPVAGLTVDAGLAVDVRFPELPEALERERERRERQRRRGRRDRGGEDQGGDGNGGDRGDGEGDDGGGDDDRGPSLARRLYRDDPVDLGSASRTELARLGPPELRTRLVDDPARHATRELVRLLAARDVEVEGRARTGEPPERTVGRVAEVVSPPLHVLLRTAVQDSDNHLADQLGLVLARARTGEGSLANIDRAVTGVFDHLGVPSEGVALSDGSGLSREDRLTARSLVALDRAMRHGPNAGLWRSLLAVAGESGTLRSRLAATPASGQLAAKTGTLRDVTALAGAVTGEDGERVHLAVLADGASGLDRAVVRTLIDELTLTIVAALDGCELTRPGGGPESPLGHPSALVRC